MIGAIAAVLTASAVLASGAAGTPARHQSAADKQIFIDFVSGPLNDSFFPPLYNGATTAAKQLGIKFHYIPIDESDIEASSVRTMQAAIAQHPDAIVVGDFVTSAVDPLIKKAVKAGIPVYVDQSGQGSWKADGAFGFIGQQGTVAGAVGGQQLRAHGAKNVLCVINVPGNPYLVAVCNGLKKAMQAKGGSASFLPLPTADSTNSSKVTTDISAYLQSHHSIDGVFCENAAVGTDAVSAVAAVHRTGKVHVGTMELSKVALQDVKAGTIDFLLNEQPYLDGYDGVLFAYHYVKFGLAPVGPVNTGPRVIDKTNIKRVMAVASKYRDVVGSS